MKIRKGTDVAFRVDPFMGEPIVVFPLQIESLQGIPLATQPALRVFINTDTLLAIGLALFVTMVFVPELIRPVVLMLCKLDWFGTHQSAVRDSGSVPDAAPGKIRKR